MHAVPETNAADPPLTPEQGEADWDELLSLVRDAVAIRHIEEVERLALDAGQPGRAERMLMICSMKKVRMKTRMGLLVDRVIDNPCWGEPPAP